MRHHQQHIEHSAQHAHTHHGLAGLFKGEYKGDEQPSHQRSAPHHSDGVGSQRTRNDAAALEVGHHPAVDALLGGILEEQQTGQQPEAGRPQKAPVDGFLLCAAFALTTVQRGKNVYQPEHKAHGCQQKHGQLGAYPGCCRDEKGAQQRTAGVAAVHQIHAPGAVGGVVADQNGAGIDHAALGDAHHKKGHRQQRHCAGQPHDGVAHRVADGQQQHAALHAQRTGQHPHQQTCQQVAHAHQGEQRTGHTVGKAVALLQQTDHHTCADSADAAEEKGCKARIAQACVLLFHVVPLFAEISFFYLTIFSRLCNRIFLQKVAKSPPGSDDLKCPPLALWA